MGVAAVVDVEVNDVVVVVTIPSLPTVLLGREGRVGAGKAVGEVVGKAVGEVVGKAVGEVVGNEPCC